MRSKICLALLTISLMVPSVAQAGKKSDAKRVQRAAQEIYRTGIPPDANGVSHTRELRLNAIPVVSFFGAWVITGKSVAFRVDPVTRQLYEPRHTKILGGGADVGIGVGLPLSGSITNEVRSFRGSEYEQWTEQTHVTGSVKLTAAAGIVPVIAVAAIGPEFGTLPGRVESSRTVFVGAFARVSIAANARVMWPATRCVTDR